MLCLAIRTSAQSEVATTNPDFAARPLYGSIQQTLDKLARTELALEEAALTDQPVDTIRSQCREVLAELNQTKQQLTQLLHDTYQKRPSSLGKNDWTVQQLESLSRNLQVKHAQAYRNLGISYPAGSLDRTDAMNRALEQLSEIVSLPLDDATVWQSRVEQVRCLRLQRKLGEARQQLQRWHQATPSAEAASWFSGEQLKTDLAAGAIEGALTSINTIQEANKPAVPETDDAILKVLLTARLRVDSTQAKRLTQQAIEQLKHISATHSAYWQRRAKIRFGQSLAASADTQDPELLSYAAASLYAAGKVDQAVETYDRIAALLKSTADQDRRFQALRSAAAIMRDSGRTTDALDRFRQLALIHARHDEAAQMHLIAIGLAAKQTRDAAPQERGERFEHYLALLREHLKQWPQQPTAKTVEQWLNRTTLPDIERKRAETLAATGNRQQAISLYNKQLKAAPDDAELLEKLAHLLSQGTDKAELREALKLWHQLEQQSKPGSLRWKRGRRARLELLDKLGEGEQAEKLRQLTKILYPAGIASDEP